MYNGGQPQKKFEIANICIMIWFVKLYVYVCSALIKPKTTEEEEEFQLRYIPSGILSTAELSLMQAKKEIAVYGERTYRMLGMVKDLFYEKKEGRFLSLLTRNLLLKPKSKRTIFNK